MSQKVPFIPYDASRFKNAHAESFTYEAYYGLKEKPFSLSANPRFLYRSKSHAAAYDDLMTAIRRREGLVVMTGEIGAGKTTLCRAVLENLGRKTFSAFVADPFLSREDLLKTLLIDFGIMSVDDLKSGRLKGASRTDLSYPLYEFLDSLAPLEAVAVAVIDEAQNLSLPLLEEVRILADLEGREKLLQVVLVGQPELRDYLKLPEMRQVDQRVTLRCEVAPLDREGVTHYVHHRLSVASVGSGAIMFSADALDAVHLASGGVPRLINLICDRALHLGYLARTDRIERELIESAMGRVGVAPGPAAGAVTATARQDAPPAPEPAVVPPPPQEPPSVILVSTESHGLESFVSETELVAPSPRAGSMPMLGGTALVAALVLMAAAGAWLFQTVVDAADDPRLPTLPPSPLFRPALELPTPAPVVAVSGTTAGRRAAPDFPAEAIVTRDVETTAPYVIKVASFQSRERADQLLDELSSAGYRVYLVETDSDNKRGRVVEVLAGRYSTRALAQSDLARMHAMPGYGDARIRGTARPGGAPQH